MRNNVNNSTFCGSDSSLARGLSPARGSGFLPGGGDSHTPGAAAPTLPPLCYPAGTVRSAALIVPFLGVRLRRTGEGEGVKLGDGPAMVRDQYL